MKIPRTVQSGVNASRYKYRQPVNCELPVLNVLSFRIRVYVDIGQGDFKQLCQVVNLANISDVKFIDCLSSKMHIFVLPNGSINNLQHYLVNNVGISPSLIKVQN